MRAMSPVNTGHGQWSSRIGLLLAAVGSAAGPGNIRKFPYTVAESGGAAFVAVYLIDALRSAAPSAAWTRTLPLPPSAACWQIRGRLLTWHTVLMALTAGVVALGVHGGIGRASRILMPALGIFWR